MIERIRKKIVLDFANRFEEHISDEIIYVTDLLYCSNKYHLRKRYPYLLLENAFNDRIIIGTLIHEGLSNFLNIKSEIPIEKEFEIDGKRMKLKGRIDMIDDDYVYEIKTVNNLKDIPGHYKLQLQIYLNLLDKEKGKLVIINLRDFSINEFEIEREKIDIEGLIYQTIRNERKPEEWECKYCVFKPVCNSRIDNHDSSLF